MQPPATRDRDPEQGRTPTAEHASVSGTVGASDTDSHAIRVDHVSHAFRAGEPIVNDVSLAVRRGQCLAIIGPSGCGKTTIMNILAGIERPRQGTASIAGARPQAGRPDVGYMLARDALLPWRTALQNVLLPLELRGGLTRRQMRATAEDRLAEVGLKDKGHSFPAELSHGMRQRVALARTLATEPQVLLLDEPFSALDAQTRVVVQSQFCRLTEQRGISTVLITHDLAEAVAVADDVAVLTNRPARVKALMHVDLPRPRDVAELQNDPQFHILYENAWTQLKDEVKGAEQ